MDTLVLHTQHTSLQQSDNANQQEHDISLLFAIGQDFPIKTGTEAGNAKDGHNHNRELLAAYAKQHDHLIHFARDAWVAIDKSIIKTNTAKVGNVFVASHDEIAPSHGQDRMLATVTWEHPDPRVGTLSQAAYHSPTKGRGPKAPNYDINLRGAKIISDWMHDAGQGKNLAFISLDSNMPDNKMDWAFGHDFTSMADELEKWQNTGHGPIDGMCSYNNDGRVHAKWFRVLNDKDKFMFTDHFMCRGAWEIRLLDA